MSEGQKYPQPPPFSFSPSKRTPSSFSDGSWERNWEQAVCQNESQYVRRTISYERCELCAIKMPWSRDVLHDGRISRTILKVNLKSDVLIHLNTHLALLRTKKCSSILTDIDAILGGLWVDTIHRMNPWTVLSVASAKIRWTRSGHRPLIIANFRLKPETVQWDVK